MGMPSEEAVIDKNAVMPDKFIAAFAIQAGFQGGDAVTAVAIALAESGGRPAAVGKNSNGSKDFGLWQINYPTWSVLIDVDPRRWDQAQVNATWARIIWAKKGGQWSDWSTFNNGKYKMYMGRGQVAVANADIAGAQQWVAREFQKAVEAGRVPPAGIGAVGAAGDIVEGVGNPLLDIVKLVGKLFDPKTWASIGIVLAGAVMLLLVGWQLLKGSGLGKSARNIRKVVPV